jgi:KDO2-lipid IV(A) lauroyltransferase
LTDLEKATSAAKKNHKQAVRPAWKTVLKTIWQAIVLFFFKILLFFAKIVPLRMMLPVGSALGDLGYLLSKRYRRVALKNLKIAYGDELDEAGRRRIARAVFRNFGKAVIEFPYIGVMPPDKIRQMVHIDAEDRRKIDEALAGGCGAIVFSSHIGNFELMARSLAFEGYRFTAVVRNDQNEAFARTINELRSNGGYGVIGRGDSVRQILKHLKSGGVIGILADQAANDLFVPFFGRLSGTVAGPAVLALRSNARLLPIFCIRQPNDTHKILVMDAFKPSDVGGPDGDPKRVMAEVNRIIELVIRQYPEQWLWLHDRWKVVPPEEAVREWETKGQVQSSAC